MPARHPENRERTPIGTMISPADGYPHPQVRLTTRPGVGTPLVAPDYPEISASFNAVSRWRRPYRCHAGNGGQVPSYCLRALLHTARLHGVVLDARRPDPDARDSVSSAATRTAHAQSEGPAKKRRNTGEERGWGWSGRRVNEGQCAVLANQLISKRWKDGRWISQPSVLAGPLIYQAVSTGWRLGMLPTWRKIKGRCNADGAGDDDRT